MDSDINVYSKVLLREFNGQKDYILNLVKQIAEIPSPTGFERTKINFIKKYLENIGFENIQISKLGNCILKIPSTSKSGKIY